MIIGEKYAKRKPGNKKNKQYAIRKCDECGKEEEARWDHVLVGRKIRGGEIDLCKICSNIGKYRKLPKGKNNGHWKHGISNTGYERITLDDGRRTHKHIFVVEQSIGRRLKKGELVHHIDMNKTNNILSNLFVFRGISNHKKCHATMEEIAYSLLGEKIFFNWQENIYQLEPFPAYNPGIDVEVKDIKTYIKTIRGKSYVAYYEKMNGESTWKRYHILLMETSIGRKLFRDEHVHHIDGNSLNNSMNNLFIMSPSDHKKCHHSLQKCVAELYIKGYIVFDNGKYYIDEQKFPKCTGSRSFWKEKRNDF